MRLINNLSFSNKSIFSVVFILLFIFSSFSFVSSFASSNIGNLSVNLTNSYSASESLKGWINISLSNEPSDSILSFKKGSTIIGEFSLYEVLNKNSDTLLKDFFYTCSPSSCEDGYSSSSGSTTKTFNLGVNQNQTVGFRLQGSYIPMIYSLSFNVNSNAPESCSNQLSVDVFDDGFIDWTNNNYNPNLFCGAENYGCYTPSTSTTTFFPGSEYCSVITLNSGAAIYVGANVTGSGAAEFRFVAGENMDEFCQATTTGSGKIGCIINKSLAGSEEITVCLSQLSGPAYSLFFEDINPCGFVDYTEQAHDFSIFIKGIKYSAPANILINISELEESYMMETFEGDCSEGCVIPIKITSGVSGNQITLDSASITYDSNGIAVIQNSVNLYNLGKTPALVTMPFNKVFVDNLEVKSGSTPGNYNLSIYLKDRKIGTQEIKVLALPVVGQLYPLNVPAGYSIDYILIGSSNSSIYTWYFGDNSTAETSTSRVKHAYTELGTETIIVNAQNELGSVNKSFTIQIISPREYINKTISFYKTKVSNLKTQTSLFPSFVKTNINSKLGLDTKEELLVSLENEYKNAGDDSSKYVSIVTQLNELNLPDFINSTTSSSGRFLFEKNMINIADARSTQNTLSVSDEVLMESIYSWSVSFLDVFGESKVYEAVYNNLNVPLLSYFNFKITPLSSLNSIYFVITDSSAILSGATSQPLGSGKVIKYENLAQGAQKSIEFLLLDRSVALYNSPVYYFPGFSDLILVDSEVICNYNDKCESSIGENSDNCRSDCKPWARIIWLWILVLFIFFVLYIVAQEWYKRHYEGYLFKNKDDLYNLINFIKNAEDQTLGRKDIYSKLEVKGWDKEQIDFAYHKYKGERTGMWEIPIFKFVEKIKVKKEIFDRKNIANPNVPPKPLIIFQRRGMTKINSNSPANKNTNLSNFGNRPDNTKPNNLNNNFNNSNSRK